MDYMVIYTHNEYRKQVLRDIENLRMAKIALRARGAKSGIYRVIRVHIGRGLVATGRYLLRQAGEVVSKPTLKAQLER